MLRVFQNFEWEVPISGDRDGGGGGGGAGRGKNDEIEDLGNCCAAAAQALQVSWLSICFFLCSLVNIYCHKFGKEPSTELYSESGPSGGASVGVTATSDDDKGNCDRAKKHSHSVEEWAQALRYAAKSSMKE